MGAQPHVQHPWNAGRGSAAARSLAAMALPFEAESLSCSISHTAPQVPTPLGSQNSEQSSCLVLESREGRGLRAGSELPVSQEADGEEEHHSVLSPRPGMSREKPFSQSIPQQTCNEPGRLSAG